ncbi:MAG: YceI family protein [Chitinophagaceae bacterium]|nr:MAG: YceI family protein [Chitinophagaceae bacterium]
MAGFRTRLTLLRCRLLFNHTAHAATSGGRGGGPATFVLQTSKHTIMKTKNNLQLLTRSFVLGLVVVLGFGKADAQVVHKNATYEIVLNGTSNVHDWSMKAVGAGLEANFVIPANVSHVTAINPPLLFNLPVKTLKSKESSMDSRAYKALNADKFPNISFKLVSAAAAGGQGNRSTVRATGLLTISGTTREIVLNAASVTNADGSVTLNGSNKIKFSEFGLKAPSFMLGALRCGDDLNINYSVRFQ